MRLPASNLTIERASSLDINNSTVTGSSYEVKRTNKANRYRTKYSSRIYDMCLIEYKLIVVMLPPLGSGYIKCMGCMFVCKVWARVIISRIKQRIVAPIHGQNVFGCYLRFLSQWALYYVYIGTFVMRQLLNIWITYVINQICIYEYCNNKYRYEFR